MEQTIGKRIMTLRKSRGMTQDQLAEHLGVTAQAVSKWENDISCPDISLLPKLAEIFQVTTDSLLGVPEKTEIVETVPKSGGFHANPEEDEGKDEDRDGKRYSFRWDISSEGLPWFAMAVLLFAVAMLLNRTILESLGSASVWELMWPSAVLALGLSSLCERISLWSGGTTLLGAYFLLTNMGILHLNLRPRWNIIILVLLIIWAVSMLLDNFRHGKKGKSHKGGASGYSVRDGRISFDGAFTSETVTVSEELFRGGMVDLSFGNYTLDLRGCYALEDGCLLKTDISFGSLTLLVPRQWRVEDHTDRSFSSITFQGSPAPDAGQVLTTKNDVSFGSLEICWDD